MVKVTKKSTLRKIEELHNSVFTGIIEMMRFNYDAPKSLELYRNLKFLEKIKAKGNGLDHLNEHIETIDGYTPVMYQMALIYAISHFEAFLNDLTKSMLKFYWKTLITKTKSLTYEELLQHESIEVLKNSLIEDEIMHFSHMGIIDKVRYYENKFKIEFNYLLQKGVRKNWNCIEKEDLVEAFAVRNIILHNGGVINKKYIQLTKKPKTLIGQKVIIDSDNTLDFIAILFRVSNSFKNVCVAKLKKK